MIHRLKKKKKKTRQLWFLLLASDRGAALSPSLHAAAPAAPGPASLGRQEATPARTGGHADPAVQLPGGLLRYHRLRADRHGRVPARRPPEAELLREIHLDGGSRWAVGGTGRSAFTWRLAPRGRRARVLSGCCAASAVGTLLPRSRLS